MFKTLKAKVGLAVAAIPGIPMYVSFTSEKILEAVEWIDFLKAYFS